MGLHFIKNGTKHDVCVKRPPLFPASATTYDNSQSGLAATRVQGAIDEVADTVFESDALASGTDLNTITKAGHYYSPSNAITQSLVNCPVSQYGFEMEVMPWSTGAAQQIFAYGETYYRRSVADAWVKGALERGSVSVTANGVKTSQTLLNELYALVDKTKLSPCAKWQVTEGASTYTGGMYYDTSTALLFNFTNLTADNRLQIYNVKLASTSDYTVFQIKTDGTITVTSNNSYVPGNGTVLKVCY